MRIVRPDSFSWVSVGIGSYMAPIITRMTSTKSPETLYKELSMRLVKQEQDTEKWLEWRRQGIGASEAATVLGVNPWESAKSLWKVKTGRKKEFTGNYHTNRGKTLEPVAREIYESLYGWKVPPACAVHDEYDFVRASLDGLRSDHRLIVELKCPTPKWHRHVLEHGIPDWHYAQVQHQLLVTGAELCHYCSYCEDWPGSDTFAPPVSVTPDRHFQEGLLRELKTFWTAVVSGVPLSGWKVGPRG